MYFLNSPSEAFDIISELNVDNLSYQCDFYHLQVQHGNITRFLEENIKRIGHIQIAQVPSRNEPSSSGELNYDFLFNALKRLSYSGYIGLEYAPKSTTVAGLEQMQNLFTVL